MTGSYHSVTEVVSLPLSPHYFRSLTRSLVAHRSSRYFLGPPLRVERSEWSGTEGDTTPGEARPGGMEEDREDVRTV